MKKLKLSLKLLCLLILLPMLNTVEAGVIVGGTRVIYNAGQREATLSIKNPDKNTDYLIQSWIDEFSDVDRGLNVPFVITPPLFRLDAEQENILRIVFIGAQLPRDRESIYWLSVKSIAATEQTDVNRLQVAIRTRIKLLYRPDKLTGSANEAYKVLNFKKEGDQLIIRNPTAYFVSLQSLKIGGFNVENPGMVPPFGSNQVAVPTSVSGNIRWQAINDFGGTSELASQ